MVTALGLFIATVACGLAFAAIAVLNISAAHRSVERIGMINAMEYEGKQYAAMPDPGAACGDDTLQCAFYNDSVACLRNACTPSGTVDGERIARHIIWIEAPQ